MAARKHPSHLERTRDKIQASMLINRLQSFVEGTVELSGPQVTAALGLIKKVVPDLSAIQHSGEGEGGEIVHRVERVIIDPAN
jgi:hypothetical protein